MSFATDLNYVMKNDASINASVTGGIFYENLPDNFALNKIWLLYYFNKGDQIDTLNTKNAYSIIDLTLVLITQTTEQLVDISEALISYLNDAMYGTVYDIKFKNDGHSFDKEKGIYTNTLNFSIITF